MRDMFLIIELEIYFETCMSSRRLVIHFPKTMISIHDKMERCLRTSLLLFKVNVTLQKAGLIGIARQTTVQKCMSVI